MGARFLVLFVVALQLVQCCDHSGGNEGERVWAAGGRAEFAARGKCWIDGECESGGKWWQGSQDDEEEVFSLHCPMICTTLMYAMLLAGVPNEACWCA